MRSVTEAAPIVQRFYEVLAAELENNPAPEVIERWAAEVIEDDQELASLIWRANAKVQMAGQLFIREIERPQATVQLEGAVPDNFLNLPFEEAIRYFEERRLVTPEELDELIEDERLRAFVLTRALSRGFAARATTLLQDSLQFGVVDLNEFIQQLLTGKGASEVDGVGYPGGARGYLETVFRTTTATSYNAGRFRQQTDPDVVAAGGVWEYLTAEDNRVRSSHAALHGKQWQIGDPEGIRAFPPNGFQCRCVVVVVDEEDASQEALDRQVDVGAAVTSGFEGAPGAVIQDEAGQA